MHFFQANKTLIGGVVLAVLAVYIYISYFRTPSDPLLTSTENSVVSSELLVTLSQLHIITLDNSIFSDPVFLSLSDFGVQIDPQNVGRRNPFSPIGSN